MRSLIAPALVLFLALPAASQETKIDLTLQYLVLATHRTGTMQDELNDAARQGYRVIAGIPDKDEAIFLLEKLPQGSGTYAYHLLATKRTSTMEKELNMAALDGFRYVPQTSIKRGDEILLLMELAPGVKQRYEYLLLATRRTSTLQKELNEASRNGFVLRGTLSSEETMAVLERPLK
jgi:hypothetical protein